MSATIDIIGKENVLKYIEHSGKSKFTIFRHGQNNANIPVFEAQDNTTVGDAMRAFEQWADVMQGNNNMYRIVVYNILDESDENQPRKTKNKAGKMEAIFALSDPGTRFYTDGKNGGQQLDAASLRASIVADLQKQQEESAVLKKLAEMTATIEELKTKQAVLEAEDDDEDDEDQMSSLLGSLQKPETLQSIAALAQALRGHAPMQTPINGVEETPTATTKEDKLKILNAAIKELYTADPDLHNDLTILARLSKNNPSLFTMVLGQLRSMA